MQIQVFRVKLWFWIANDRFFQDKTRKKGQNCRFQPKEDVEMNHFFDYFSIILIF